MSEITADILIVGSGLGATAAAVRLSGGGRSVVMVPGIGSTRSPHVDGGLIDASLVERVFGPGAPLGWPVAEMRQPGERFGAGQVSPVSGQRIYRRAALEQWAMSRATAAGATFLGDFIEETAIPQPDGTITLTSERDDRRIRAGIMVLCEGADPRIPLKVRLRPDYGPEDQVHFARTILNGSPFRNLTRDRWRTGWGMPVEVSVVPQDDGVIVAVSARIENVMRSSRSAKDALEDLLSSPEWAARRLTGERGDTGVELVALRPDHRDIPFISGQMVMGIDASGVIDARDPERANLTLRGGLELADVVLSRELTEWQEAATTFLREHIPSPQPYRDDRVTGFLEDGTVGNAPAIARRLAGIVRRVRQGSAR
jgi:flavin-dependent dehydrogenase